MADAIPIGDEPHVTNTDDVTVNYWNKKGRRLYLNDISSRGNPYLDLDAGTVEDGFSGEDYTVEHDGNTLVVTREYGTSTTVVEIDLDVDAPDDTSDSSDDESPESEYATDPSPAADRTYTIGDWLAGHHPELAEEISLEVGMVFFNITDVTGDEPDGYHVVYLGRGRLSSLDSGLSMTEGDSSIRNKIHTGKFEPVPRDDLTDEQLAAWRDELNGEMSHLQEYASTVDDDEWAANLRAHAERLKQTVAEGAA